MCPQFFYCRSRIPKCKVSSSADSPNAKVTEAKDKGIIFVEKELWTLYTFFEASKSVSDRLRHQFFQDVFRVLIDKFQKYRTIANVEKLSGHSKRWAYMQITAHRKGTTVDAKTRRAERALALSYTVTNFLLQPLYSREYPDFKRACHRLLDGTLVRRRLLLDYYRDLYEQFLADGHSCSYGAFRRAIPPQLFVKPSAQTRQQCLCYYCEYTRQLVNALTKSGCIDPARSPSPGMEHAHRIAECAVCPNDSTRACWLGECIKCEKLTPANFPMIHVAEEALGDLVTFDMWDKNCRLANEYEARGGVLLEAELSRRELKQLAKIEGVRKAQETRRRNKAAKERREAQATGSGQDEEEEGCEQVSDLTKGPVGPSGLKKVSKKQGGGRDSQANLAFIEVTMSKARLLQEFVDHMQEFRTHEYVKQHTYNARKNAVTALPPKHFNAYIDFSENIEHTVGDRVHFTDRDASTYVLHPMHVYYRRDENSAVEKFNLAIISDDQRKTVPVVHLHLRLFAKWLEAKVGEKPKGGIIYSDGAGGSYKNYHYVAHATFAQLDLGFPVHIGYCCSYHGKGPSDGLGGAVKRRLRERAWFYPKSGLGNYVAFMMREVNLMPGVDAMFVSKEDVDECFENIKTLGETRWKAMERASEPNEAGLRRSHLVVVKCTRSTRVYIAEVSLHDVACFCGEFMEKLTCSQRPPANMTFRLLLPRYDLEAEIEETVAAILAKNPVAMGSTRGLHKPVPPEDMRLLVDDQSDGDDNDICTDDESSDDQDCHAASRILHFHGLDNIQSRGVEVRIAKGI